MFYYRHNGYIVIEKSETELTGGNVVHSSENYDLELYDVTIGFLSETNEILRDTKKLRGVNAVVKRLDTITEYTADVELDIDYRLSLIESGLV